MKICMGRGDMVLDMDMAMNMALNMIKIIADYFAISSLNAAAT